MRRERGSDMPTVTDFVVLFLVVFVLVYGLDWLRKKIEKLR